MNPEEVQNKKSLLPKISIIILIAVIFCLWLANLNNVFDANSTSTDDTFKKISADIDESLAKVNAKLNKTVSSTSNTFVDDLLEKASSSTATSTVKIELKEELKGLIKTATTTNKKIGCPEYINCMPTIGDAKPCVIPAGCEKITKIAY
jgi:hypothetical protein